MFADPPAQLAGPNVETSLNLEPTEFWQHLAMKMVRRLEVWSSGAFRRFSRTACFPCYGNFDVSVPPSVTPSPRLQVQKRSFESSTLKMLSKSARSPKSSSLCKLFTEAQGVTRSCYEGACASALERNPLRRETHAGQALDLSRTLPVDTRPRLSFP